MWSLLSLWNKSKLGFDYKHGKKYMYINIYIVTYPFYTHNSPVARQRPRPLNIRSLGETTSTSPKYPITWQANWNNKNFRPHNRLRILQLLPFFGSSSLNGRIDTSLFGRIDVETFILLNFAAYKNPDMSPYSSSVLSTLSTAIISLSPLQLQSQLSNLVIIQSL